jgi:hypothetical protein
MGGAIREKSASIEVARYDSNTPPPSSSGVYARDEWIPTVAARAAR